MKFRKINILFAFFTIFLADGLFSIFRKSVFGLSYQYFSGTLVNHTLLEVDRPHCIKSRSKSEGPTVKNVARSQKDPLYKKSLEVRSKCFTNSKNVLRRSDITLFFSLFEVWF